MPDYDTRIDPITGCRVLSMRGFMQSQADHNGTTEQEEWERFNQDMVDIEMEELDNIMNPERFIDMVNNAEDQYPCKFCGDLLHLDKDVWVDDTNGDVCSGDDNLNNENEQHQVAPFKIKRIFWIDEDTAYGGGMFSGNQHLEVRAEREDGFHGWFVYDYKYYAGSRLDPPDYALTAMWSDGNGVEY